MPRNGAGVYSLPAGNPVVTLTTISSTWANATMTDIATALTGSLPVNGSAPMTGQLKLSDGVVGAPALTWNNETTSGWYRVGAGDYGFSILNSKILEISATFLSLLGAARYDLTVTGTNNGNQVGSFTNNSTGVAGNQTVLAANSANNLALVMTSTGFTGAYITGGPSGQQGVLAVSGANPLTLGTNATARVVIAAIGTVTIAAPTSGVATLIIGGQTGGQPQILFGAGSGAYATPAGNNGILHYQASGNKLSFGAIASAGNTSIDFHITVGGVDTILAQMLPSTAGMIINSPAAGVASLRLNPFDSASVGLNIQDPGVNATQVRINTNNTQVVMQALGTTTALVLQTSGGVVMTLGAAGNVTVSAPASGSVLTVNGLTGTLVFNNNGILVLTPNTSQVGITLNISAAGIPCMAINTSATTGAGTPTFAANKPTGSSATATWLPVLVDGATRYIPVWA